MSLFDSLQGNSQNAQGSAQVNMQDALNRLRSNPSQVLKQAGLNIPNGMNNPQQIIQHLIQSGQVPNQRFQMLQQMMMGRR